MMAYGRNPKVIAEEIDDLKLELGKLTKEAYDLIGRCKSESRELNKEEDRRFNAICGKGDDDGLVVEIKNQIKQLEAELETAEQRKHSILNHVEQKRMHPSTMVFQNTYSDDRRPVLPVNGRVPGEQPKRYQQYNRVARLKAFKDEQAAFDSGVWLRAVSSRLFNGTINRADENYLDSIGLSIENAAGESSGAAGGYVLPAPVSSTIIDIKEMTGVARQVCQVLPTSGDTLTVPKRSTGLTVYAPGEGDALTDSDMAWKQVECILKKRAVLSYLSNELNDDSLINYTDQLVGEMAYALAYQEDRELINGTGAATTYFGVRGLLSSIGSAGVSTAATGHDTWPELDIADFAAAIGKLPGRYHQFSPVWICSPEFYWATMARIAFSAGGVTMAEVLSAQPGMRSFMGYRVFTTPHMPTATATATVCCLFGAFDRGVLMADRGGVKLARSDEYRFANDQIALRATSRYDINVHDAGDSSAAGSYVALKTAS